MSDIGISSAGIFNLTSQQQRWNLVESGSDSGAMEALFAGQTMSCMRDGGSFTLHYLGFSRKGFKDMQSAHRGGPRFARDVLDRMRSLILGGE